MLLLLRPRKSPLDSCEFAEGGQEPVHFFGGVVMDQPDAQHAALRLHAETFAEVERVVVAVPGKDAAIAEKFGDGRRMMIPEAEGKSGAALGGMLHVGDAINA